MNKILFLIFFLILSFLNIKFSLAIEFFKDDFSDSNLYNRWDFVNGLGGSLMNWRVEDGNLIGEISSKKHSYLYPKITNGNELANYVFEADVINQKGVDQPFLFRLSDDRKKYYQVDYRYNESRWPQDSNNITLRRINGFSNILLARFNSSEIAISQGINHKLKVIFNENNIKVFFDDNLVIDFTDNINYSFKKGSFGILNWGGDCSVGSKNIFDNIKLVSLDNRKTNKIIFLPGLGAGWNTDAMVYNKEVPDSDWKMVSFVKNYDGFIEALEAKGLAKDKDFFVWNYDWRKPISEIEVKLDKFINEKIEAGEKVDLVGHSFGGLIARIWSQDHKDSDKLGKIITLGSPNSGAISAYEAWNGGKIFEGAVNPASIALNVLVQLHKNKGETKVDALRNFAPSVRDLLPVFDFIKKNNKIISNDKLETKNDFLKNKNLAVNYIFDKFKAFVGLGQQTNEWINIADRSIFDKVLGIWPDGKPISYIKTKDGDGTVPKKSAKFEGDIFETTNSGHMDIVDSSLGKIFTELGLGTTVAPISFSNNDLSSGLVFFIGSPAYLSVKCGENPEVKSDEMGFVFIKNNNLDQCKVSVVGTDNGIYHLVTGKTDNEDSWQYFEDEVSTGSARTIDVDAKTGKLVLRANNVDYFYELIKKDIENLLSKDEFKENKNLMAMLEAINIKDINALTDKLFLFRKDKKEILITNRMIDRVGFILTVENKNISLTEAKNIYTKALQNKSLVDTKVRLNSRKNINPSYFSAISYQKSEELLIKAAEQLKLSNFGETMADSILVSKLLLEVF